MKNFKLLLASTAILSTTLAMGANADPLPALPDATANLNVQIGLFNAAGITVEEDTIDFGVLAATGAHTDASVRLNPNGGARTITGAGVVAADSGSVHKLAYLDVNVPTGYTATLNVPNEILLLDNYTKGVNDLTFVPEKYLYKQRQVGNLTLESYYIGGSIDLSDEFHGAYSGSFTVTAVYSEDTTPSSGD